MSKIIHQYDAQPFKITFRAEPDAKRLHVYFLFTGGTFALDAYTNLTKWLRGDIELRLNKSNRGNNLNIEFSDNETDLWELKHLGYNQKEYDVIANMDKDEFEYFLHFRYIENGMEKTIKTANLFTIHFD